MLERLRRLRMLRRNATIHNGDRGNNAASDNNSSIEVVTGLEVVVPSPSARAREAACGVTHEEAQSSPLGAGAHCCWICLDEAADGNPLAQPCRCPRKVHPLCLARWQMRSAGSKEEECCRFCDEKLPDWRYMVYSALVEKKDDRVEKYQRSETMTRKTDRSLKSAGASSTPVARLEIVYKGRVHKVKAKYGDFQGFLREVYRVTGLPASRALDMSFEQIPDPFSCSSPTAESTSGGGTSMSFRGADAFDAVVVCCHAAAARAKSKR